MQTNISPTTGELSRLAGELEEKLTDLTTFFSFLPLPGGTSAASHTDALTRQLAEAVQVTDGLRAVEGMLQRTDTGTDGRTAGYSREDGWGEGGMLGRRRASSAEGYYRQTRALRRVSELILRT